jgi:hypothetical protein
VKNAHHQIGRGHLATFGILECVARKRFELGPKTGVKLGEFAKRAIIHQPLDYAGWVVIDLVKYIDPAIAPRRVYDATPREVLSFGWRDGTIEIGSLTLCHIPTKGRTFVSTGNTYWPSIRIYRVPAG